MDQKTTVVKRGKSVSFEICGIYRSKKLPAPVVGETLRVVNQATQEEFPGTVIAVDEEAGTYNISIPCLSELEGIEGIDA